MNFGKIDLGKIPRPGMRTVKTAIAVVLVMTFSRAVLGAEYWMNNAVLACIVAVICLQDTVDKTLKEGAARFLGTLMGGAAGAAILYTGIRDHSFAAFAAASGVCIIAVIYACNLLNRSTSVAISCVVFLKIALGISEAPPALQALESAIQTLVGITAAYGVNKFVYAPDPHRVHKQSEVGSQEAKVPETAYENR